MNREQLEHAIRAACTVSEDEELIVFGSQAILGQYPDAPSELSRLNQTVADRAVIERAVRWTARIAGSL